MRKIVGFGMLLGLSLTGCVGEGEPVGVALGYGGSPSVTTDQSSYTSTDTITVDFMGVPASTNTWFTLAAEGSALTDIVAYHWNDGGAASGSFTFAAPLSSGSYVVRCHRDGTYFVVAESIPFTVTAATISLTTNAGSYTSSDTVVVTFANVPPSANTWFSMAPAGSSVTTLVNYQWNTGATSSGSFSFPAPTTAGSYVIRCFRDGTYFQIAESTAFTVTTAGVTLTTNASSYTSTDTVGVTYGGVPASTNTWFTLAPQGSSLTTVTAYRWNDAGTASGSFGFAAPTTSGSYVIRCFRDAGYFLVAESVPFTVTAPSITLATDAASYTDLDTIMVTFAGVPPSANTWFTLAPQGSSVTTSVDYYWNTPATASGSFPFYAPSSAGTYVIRCFRDGGYFQIAESTPFTVTTTMSSASVMVPAVLDQGAGIPVTFAGFPNSGSDWIAIAHPGDPTNTYITTLFITGTSGVANFAVALAPGTYEARGFFDYDVVPQRYVLRASTTFTIASALTRISVATGGTEGNDNSYGGSISAGASAGRYVAFSSRATNLVAGDTNTFADIFLRDRVSGGTTRVSVSSSGAQANASSDKARVSDDGRYVTFTSFATNLVSILDPNASTSDVFVRDTTSGTTVCASVTPSGTTGNGASAYSDITPDGRYVVFHSLASDLVAGDTNGTYDVFVRDLVAGTTERISVATSGAEGNAQSAFSRISDDGRYVVFSSSASNFVAGDTSTLDFFLRDRTSGTTIRISTPNAGGNGNFDAAGLPEMTGDAEYILFASYATNLVTGDTNGFADLFLYRRSQGNLARVSIATDGSEPNAAVFFEGFGISDDGRYVVWSSTATNVVAGDVNGVEDVFRRDLALSTTSSLSAGGDGLSRRPLISSDGRRVIFETLATNLVAGDTNGVLDVYTIYQ